MKIFLSTILMSLLVVSVIISQSTKPNTGKNYPTFVKFNYNVSPDQKDALFQEYLQLSEHDQMQLLDSRQDDLGFTHDKYEQYFGGVKVDGSTVTIHTQNGRVISMSGNYRNIKETNVSPIIFPLDAFDLAIGHVGAERYAWDEGGFLGNTSFTRPEPELVIVSDQQSMSPPRLAYKMEIHATYPLYNSDVYVDATTGVILKEVSKICTADAIGTGATRYSGTQTIHTDSNSGSYRMRDYSRGSGILTYDATTATSDNPTTGEPNGSSEYTDNDNNWTAAEYNNASKDNAALDAHFAAAATYDFFSSAFGRNSYDGNGAAIKSYVNCDIEAVFNYPAGYNDNAFWTGYLMVYGKGGTYDPLTTVDITGHEIGHAFCEYTANLTYSYQSGAMNESLSDIWGACVENYTNINNGTNKDLWNLGSEIGTTFRSMSNPNAYGQPDTYLGTNWYTGSGDNGGVHYNSGVGNHWFYILTVGKSGTNDNNDSYSVTGIGIDKAAAIAWRSEDVYMTSSSQYSNWRTYAIQSAEDLYGAESAEVIATTNAWYAVGVGAEYTGPASCVTPSVDLSITFDNYPEETSWTIKDSGGTTVESGGTYGSQADGSTLNLSFTLAAGDYTFTINDSYGDGICCSYGSGSYTFSSGATTIVNGGTFGSSEITGFCVEGGGDTQAPSVPTNLSASNTTQTTTDLSWNASSDNIGVTGYEVFSNSVSIGTVTGTAANITGLSTGTTYTFGVRAFDAAGNNSATTSLNVTTLSAGDTQAPTTPTGLTASNTTQTTTDLSWNTSSDNVGVTGYDVYVGGSLNGSSATTSYTVSGLTAATTYNNIYVIAKDAAGNQSTPSGSISITTQSTGGGGPTELMGSYFESGWDGWSDGGNDCARYSGSRSYEGNYSIRIRDNSGTSSSMTSSSVNVVGYTQLELKFYFYSYSMENGEDFWVRYYNGSTWTTIATYAQGTSFNNNSFYTATVTLNSSSYTFPSNAQFRFQCDASGNQDHIYIDQVTLTGSNPTGFLANEGETRVTIDELERTIEGETELENEEQVKDGVILFPNPANDQLSYATDLDLISVKIFSINGLPVKEVTTLDETETLDISQLNPGIYFLTIETEDNVIVKRFIKQ
jgi:Zn-dependent metalloprotease